MENVVEVSSKRKFLKCDMHRAFLATMMKWKLRSLSAVLSHCLRRKADQFRNMADVRLEISQAQF